MEDLKELILLVNEYLYVQNHSPNFETQVFIRKIYNYLSGDVHGSFPNDGVQLSDNPIYGKITRSEKLRQGSFKLKDGLIIEDKIQKHMVT